MQERAAHWDDVAETIRLLEAADVFYKRLSAAVGRQIAPPEVQDDE